MDGNLSADIICSKTRSVFRERNSRKTVSFEEQIIPKDKYMSIFSRKIDVTVFILQIFRTAGGKCSEQFPVSCAGYSPLSVLWYSFIKQQKRSLILA